MQSVSFPDLQVTTPSTLRKKLISEGILVVTINNKPFAAMLDLSDENAQDTLLLASRLRAQIAALSIRNQARQDGMDKTTLKEVNAVIRKTRMEHKRYK
jgi:hypothetical protein